MQAYAQRRKAGAAPVRAASEAEGPSIRQIAAGAAPTNAQMGSRVDLPGEIREKMENSFGTDFSNVKLYESQTVADAGAEAVTQGSNIAFAPGKLDLTSTAGQALLGHELSHVVSQSRGESAGRGFLNDAHLEAQADRQGMMAAQGESAYQGPVSPVGVSSTASAAGPMQAKKKKEELSLEQQAEANGISEPELDIAQTNALNAEVHEPIRSKYIKGTTDNFISTRSQPFLWQTIQDWQIGTAKMNGRNLNGKSKPTEEDMENAWKAINSNGEVYEHTWDLFGEKYNGVHRDHAYSGLSYDNYKLGVANARERRGYDKE